MEKIKEIINIAYREITKKGYFDINKGNEPIKPNLNMSEIPKVMTDYVNECGYGCCFVFSAYMLEILEKYNVNAYMVLTVEDTGIRASVMYQDEDTFYIANPVEDIEYFTENKVEPEDRKKYYIDDTATMLIDGKTHDDSRYTIDDFAKKYGKIWVLGKMNIDVDMTLASAMANKNNNCIAPPEEANVDVKKYKR